MRSTDTPFICPLCEIEFAVQGVDEATWPEMRRMVEPNTAGLPSMNTVEWKCPRCENWITKEDEEEVAK